MSERETIAAQCRKWAVERFDEHGPYDPRGAALWDVAAWLLETADEPASGARSPYRQSGRMEIRTTAESEVLWVFDADEAPIWCVCGDDRWIIPAPAPATTADERGE